MKGKSIIFGTIFLVGAAFMGMSGPDVQAAEKPQMSYEEYPRIDGSLACVPLCEALAVEMTGCTTAQAEETMADFTNTNPSYLQLAKGNTDILLAYEPAESTKEELENYAPLDMRPVGKDALVFLVNEANPVESLTQQQAYDIYTGRITNWSEVGGEDIEIKAFQRPETSGSQTMLRKLLIGDADMAEAEKEMIAVGMDDIIEALEKYDNTANALGYSVYYYTSEMFRQPGLKFLQVDGVEPSGETIASGEYPLINEFYCVTSEQSSDRAKEIRDWLLTEDGQAFVESCGYVSVPPITSRTITGSSKPGEKSASLEVPICDEDEYVLLDAGNNYAEIYDCQGNYVSECRAYMDRAYEACIVKKDSVLAYNDGGTWCIYSMAELDHVLQCDSEEYSLQYCNNVFLVTDQRDGSFSLYDEHGNSLYRYEPEEGALQSTDTGGEENSWQGRIVALDSGYVIGACNFAEDSSASVRGPVWISTDGQENKEISDVYLANSFAEWSMHAFGDYVRIYDWNNEEGGVYNLDGSLLLDQIVSFCSPYSESDWLSIYSSDGSEKTALAIQNEDGMCLVYNTQLQECAMLPEPEGGVWDIGYAAGFIKGVAYEQLDGEVCDGFVRCSTKTWCPYAKTENGWLVYADGELLSVSADSGQDLVALNEMYIRLGYVQDDSYTERLIDRKTGETVLESFWDATGGTSMELGTDYCIVTETKADGEDYQTSFTIRDAQNQICCSVQNASARAWKNGYILMNRGIYHGIADSNGNWIVKTIYGWEE